MQAAAVGRVEGAGLERQRLVVQRELRGADAARIAHLVELAVDFSTAHLKPDGALVAKMFHGSGYSQLVKLFRNISGSSSL